MAAAASSAVAAASCEMAAAASCEVAAAAGPEAAGTGVNAAGVNAMEAVTSVVAEMVSVIAVKAIRTVIIEEAVAPPIPVIEGSIEVVIVAVIRRPNSQRDRIAVTCAARRERDHGCCTND